MIETTENQTTITEATPTPTKKKKWWKSIIIEMIIVLIAGILFGATNPSYKANARMDFAIYVACNTQLLNEDLVLDHGNIVINKIYEENEYGLFESKTSYNEILECTTDDPDVYTMYLTIEVKPGNMFYLNDGMLINNKTSYKLVSAEFNSDYGMLQSEEELWEARMEIPSDTDWDQVYEDAANGIDWSQTEESLNNLFS